MIHLCVCPAGAEHFGWKDRMIPCPHYQLYIVNTHFHACTILRKAEDKGSHRGVPHISSLSLSKQQVENE